MTILLDIDGVLIDSNRNIHPRAEELFEKFNVVFYSAEDDIAEWAEKYEVTYISKHSEEKPSGYILIDDDERFEKMVDCQYYFKSIDEFFEVVD